MKILYTFFDKQSISKFDCLLKLNGIDTKYQKIENLSELKLAVSKFEPLLIIHNLEQDYVNPADFFKLINEFAQPDSPIILITNTEVDSDFFLKFKQYNIAAVVSPDKFVNALPSINYLNKISINFQADVKALYYRDILLHLSKSQSYLYNTLDIAIEDVTNLIAGELNADCVGIWFIDNVKSELRCLDFFQVSSVKHIKDTRKPLAHYNKYIDVLSADKIICANDIRENSVYSPLIQDNIVPSSIKSELDAAFFSKGKFMGAITCSTLNSFKEWSTSEQTFLSSAAELVAYWIENHQENLKNLTNKKDYLIYDKVYKNLNDLICITDTKFCITAVSDSIDKVLGYKESEMLGKYIMDFGHPKELKTLVAGLNRALTEKTSFGSKFRFLKKDGTYAWLKNFCNFITNDAGDINSIIFISQEITDNVLIQEKLIKAEQEFEQILDSIDAAVWHSESNSNFSIYVNKPIEKITGYSIDDWKNIPNFWENHIFPDDREWVNSVYKDFRHNDLTNYEMEYRFIANGHRVIWIKDKIKIIRENGVPTEFIGVMLDITVKKENEAKLIESENKFRTVIETTNNAIFILDLENVKSNYKFFLTNIAATKMFLYTKEEFLNLLPNKLTAFDFDLCLKNILSSDECVLEKEMIRKDNSTFFAEITLKKIFLLGKEMAFLNIADITKRKAALDQLQLFKKIIDLTNEAVLIEDRNGDAVYYNQAFISLFKIDETNPKAFSKYNVFTPDSYEKIKAGLRNMAENGGTWESNVEGLNSDGKPFPINISTGIIKNELGSPIFYFGFIKDLTKQNKLNARLKKLSTAVEQSPTSVVITDIEGNIEYVNPKFEEITGYTFEEAVGKNPRILKTDLHNLDWYKKLWGTLCNGEVWHGEFRNKKKSGEIYWEKASISPIKNESDQITNFLAVKEDITKSKMTNELLISSLHEKENLLKEIHHRVKNNLQVISSLLSLQSDYIEDDHTKELFNESRNRIKSMALIHERLYQANNLAQIDFSEYINDLVNGLLRTYRSKSQLVKLNLKTDLIYLPIDYAVPCGLIINELISNALKYATVGKNEINLDVLFNVDGKNCSLIVADDGPGIPQNIALGNTSTLGLQLVNDLAQQLEGTLTLNRDKGTEFILNFNLGK